MLPRSCYCGHGYTKVSNSFTLPDRCRVLVPEAVKGSIAQKKTLSTPNISYSTAKAEICLQDLKLLYRSVYSSNSVSGSAAQHSFFHHWALLSGNEADKQLQVLLDKSVAVVAAFTRDSGIYGGADAKSELNTSGAGSSSSWDWGWRKPRRLVGFARAAGDSSLVATVHDVLVHPELQGYGLGSVLLRRLLNRVSSEGVFDVGLVTPSSLQSFFHSCSFELDKEDSVPMALNSCWCKSEVETNAPLQKSTSLLELLNTAMDKHHGHGTLR